MRISVRYRPAKVLLLGLAYAAKTALDTGGDVISNLASGQNLKTAAKGGFSRQKHLQKIKAVNAIKNMVNPRRRVNNVV